MLTHIEKRKQMYILALNCGSSSLKYQVFDANSKTAVVGGNVEKIGLLRGILAQRTKKSVCGSC